MSYRSGDSPPDDLPGLETLAFVSLGSNLESEHGSPAHTLVSAMDRLAPLSERPLLRSSLWRTRPVDCPPGSPDFVNAVVGLQPRAEQTPEALLDALLRLEDDFGRRRGEIPNAPRTLDLDLISFAGTWRDGRRLTLPHPAAHLRGFVLLPLAEIAPDLRLPGQQLTVAELAAGLGNGECRISPLEN